jgi:hypothetical protein
LDGKFSLCSYAYKKKSMARINFVLIDFENVQPKDIGLLVGGPFKICRFRYYFLSRLSLKSQYLQFLGPYQSIETLSVIRLGDLHSSVPQFFGDVLREWQSESRFSLVFNPVT